MVQCPKKMFRCSTQGTAGFFGGFGGGQGHKKCSAKQSFVVPKANLGPQTWGPKKCLGCALLNYQKVCSVDFGG